ncbi:MAG: hypothetical protein IMW98_08660 [Firmicutes bacterium]|nr:hypothetical protein [Bacillota bacterium]MBE3590877.1 hypothetical protein [Bacillota bacterium]
MEQFMELSWTEPCTVEEFVERLAGGVYGQVSREEILAFIDRIAAITMGNIEVKAAEGGPWAERAEEVAEEQRERFARLRARFRG